MKTAPEPLFSCQVSIRQGLQLRVSRFSMCGDYSTNVWMVSVANCGAASEALWVSLPPIRLSLTTTCLSCLQLTIACSSSPLSRPNSSALLHRERNLSE